MTDHSAITTAYQRAMGYLQRGDIDAAEPWIEQVTRSIPAWYVEVQDTVARVAREQGRYDRAAAALSNALVVHPDPNRAYHLGENLADLGDDEEAARAFSRAVQMDVSHTDAHIRLGMVHQSLNRLEQARGCFERAILNDPRAAVARYYLALNCLETGDSRRALSQLHFVLQIEPNYAPARMLQGQIFQQIGDHRQALVEYVAALELGGGDTDTYLAMATSFEAIGDLGQAARAIEKAWNEDRSLATDLLRAGQMRVQLGHIERAVQIFTICTKIDLTATGATEALADLRQRYGELLDEMGQTTPNLGEGSFKAPPVQTKSQTAPMDIRTQTRQFGQGPKKAPRTAPLPPPPVPTPPPSTMPPAIDDLVRGVQDAIRNPLDGLNKLFGRKDGRSDR
jgi:tetratricopeptide (TPR) repeat protein